jgi:hypothetical protein
MAGISNERFGKSVIRNMVLIIDEVSMFQLSLD